MLNACWMHALHMWTRLTSALMFISVPLFASQINQKHTDQCVSGRVWHGQVPPKSTSRTTNRNTYALPPLLSCCSLLSHKCGWVFGWSMHVVRIRLTGAMVIEILHHLTHNTVQPERRRYISPWAANYSHRKHSRTHGHYNWNAERPHWIRIPIQWFCLSLWKMFVPKTIKQRRPCKKDWNENTKL